MGKQYPDINSNPQKIIFLASIAVNVLTGFILAIIGIVWFSKLEICTNLISGKPAGLYYLSIVSSIVGLVSLVFFIICFIIYLVFKQKQMFINNQELSHKIMIGNGVTIINFFASILAIGCSTYGLNHNSNGMCDKYLAKIININMLCPYGGGPDYSSENEKIYQKIAEDPGYYCEKNGIPMLIISIINIISAIAYFVAYRLGKKNPIEESSIAEGQEDIENNQDDQNQI